MSTTEPFRVQSVRVHYRIAALAAVGAALAVAACRSTPSRPAGELTGAPSARGAVERFLAAVRAQDLQAMAVVWGTKNGPARDAIPRDQLERREIIMAQCLAHDSSSFLDESPVPSGARQVRFVLYHGPVNRTTVFITESGAESRWYVREIDLRSTHSCTTEAGSSPVR